MKPAVILSGLLFALLAVKSLAQSGLTGEYYTGTSFERKVLTRTDRQIQFNWAKGSPAAGIPHSYYSIRWTGKLLAPASGKYGFYAKVDDGIRVWVGNRKVMDSWQLNDSKSFIGYVVLEAGRYYDLRVDYFNDMLEGEITLYWQRPDAQKASLGETPGEPIPAQFFAQPKSVIAALPKPPANSPKTLPKSQPQPAKIVTRQVISAKPQVKPVLIPPAVTRSAEQKKPDTTTVSTAPKPTPVPADKPLFTQNITLVLRNVQFEQSSYVLLPESSVELNQLVAAMKANPLWHIEVAGHTDNVGDPRLNLALSENRAKVVATYLIRCGLADERITTKGYGGTRPIADNTLDSARPKNRRVEIAIR